MQTEENIIKLVLSKGLWILYYKYAEQITMGATFSLERKEEMEIQNVPIFNIYSQRWCDVTTQLTNIP